METNDDFCVYKCNVHWATNTVIQRKNLKISVIFSHNSQCMRDLCLFCSLHFSTNFSRHHSWMLNNCVCNNLFYLFFFSLSCSIATAYFHGDALQHMSKWNTITTHKHSFWFMWMTHYLNYYLNYNFPLCVRICALTRSP